MKFKIEEKIQTKAIADVSISFGGKVFQFSWAELGGGLVGNYLNIKFRSKFNHGFTNRDCLHCAILKALYGFKEKMSPQGKRYVIFSSKCSK